MILHDRISDSLWNFQRKNKLCKFIKYKVCFSIYLRIGILISMITDYEHKLRELKYPEIDCQGFSNAFCFGILKLIDLTKDPDKRHQLIHVYKVLRPIKHSYDIGVYAGETLVDKYGKVCYKRAIKALNDYLGYDVEPILKSSSEYNEFVDLANSNGGEISIEVDDVTGLISVIDYDTTNVELLDEM